MRLASAVICLSVALSVACKSQQVTCGKGTREEHGTCVAVEAPAPPTPEPKPAAPKTGPLAVAIVMNGWELWVGNDQEIPQITKDDPSRYPGLLIELRSALDKNKIGTWGPAGSLGMVITYADKPVIRVPMGPLGELTGRSLGTQADYFGTTGVELVSAVRLALGELRKVQTPRRALIVICDGNDTNNDVAKSHLESLKKQAAQDGVQTFGIVYKSKLSAESNVLPVMIPETKQIGEATEIDAAIAAIVTKL